MVRFLELRKRSMRNHNVRKLYDLNNMFQAFCVPVSVPMEFLPVPIAAQVWVQRYVRIQSYQSQFLWIPPSSYGCPGGGAKVCSPSKLPASVPMDSSQFLWLPCLRGQRYVEPECGEIHRKNQRFLIVKTGVC